MKLESKRDREVWNAAIRTAKLIVEEQYTTDLGAIEFEENLQRTLEWQIVEIND